MYHVTMNLNLNISLRAKSSHSARRVLSKSGPAPAGARRLPRTWRHCQWHAAAGHGHDSGGVPGLLDLGSALGQLRLGHCCPQPRQPNSNNLKSRRQVSQGTSRAAGVRVRLAAPGPGPTEPTQSGAPGGRAAESQPEAGGTLPCLLHW